MSLPLPVKPILPLPQFAARPEPLFPMELCAGPRMPDATWTRTDGKEVNVWLERHGRRCELQWTLDGVSMRPSDHSSEEWARAEMERWRERDTMIAKQPEPGMTVRLDSGRVVKLIAFSMEPVWRSKHARRSWIVEKVEGFRKGGKPRLTVTEAEVLRGMADYPEVTAATSVDPETLGKTIDLMAALRASLAKGKRGPKGAA